MRWLPRVFCPSVRLYYRQASPLLRGTSKGVCVYQTADSEAIPTALACSSWSRCSVSKEAKDKEIWFVSRQQHAMWVGAIAGPRSDRSPRAWANDRAQIVASGSGFRHLLPQRITVQHAGKKRGRFKLMRLFTCWLMRLLFFPLLS
jgi:hypothetical protein